MMTYSDHGSEDIIVTDIIVLTDVVFVVTENDCELLVKEAVLVFIDDDVVKLVLCWYWWWRYWQRSIDCVIDWRW